MKTGISKLMHKKPAVLTAGRMRASYTNEQLVLAAAENPAFLQFKSPRDPEFWML